MEVCELPRDSVLMPFHTLEENELVRNQVIFCGSV